VAQVETGTKASRARRSDDWKGGTTQGGTEKNKVAASLGCDKTGEDSEREREGSQRMLDGKRKTEEPRKALQRGKRRLGPPVHLASKKTMGQALPGYLAGKKEKKKMLQNRRGRGGKGQSGSVIRRPEYHEPYRGDDDSRYKKEWGEEGECLHR